MKVKPGFRAAVIFTGNCLRADSLQNSEFFFLRFCQTDRCPQVTIFGPWINDLFPDDRVQVMKPTSSRASWADLFDAWLQGSWADLLDLFDVNFKDRKTAVRVSVGLSLLSYDLWFLLRGHWQKGGRGLTHAKICWWIWESEQMPIKMNFYQNLSKKWMTKKVPNHFKLTRLFPLWEGLQWQAS